MKLKGIHMCAGEALAKYPPKDPFMSYMQGSQLKYICPTLLNRAPRARESGLVNRAPRAGESGAARC